MEVVAHQTPAISQQKRKMFSGPYYQSWICCFCAGVRGICGKAFQVPNALRLDARRVMPKTQRGTVSYHVVLSPKLAKRGPLISNRVSGTPTCKSGPHRYSMVIIRSQFAGLRLARSLYCSFATQVSRWQRHGLNLCLPARIPGFGWYDVGGSDGLGLRGRHG